MKKIVLFPSETMVFRCGSISLVSSLDPIGYKRRSRFVIGRDRETVREHAQHSRVLSQLFSISKTLKVLTSSLGVLRYLVICIRKVGSKTSSSFCQRYILKHERETCHTAMAKVGSSRATYIHPMYRI